MPLRIVQISAPDKSSKNIEEIVEKHDAVDSWHSTKNKDGRRVTNILIHLDQQQNMMDDLQKALNKEKDWRLVVLPVEASVPQIKETQSAKHRANIVRGTITREELYNEVVKGSQIDQNFLLLVFLSTIVAAIGLINDNVAVIIGAMVIAPLLGPYLALAFGAALGDKSLIIQSIKANLAGIGLTLFISILMGSLLSIPLDGPELTSRSEVGFDALVLAFAAGAAGVLSLTTGLSGTLVGVMVAVALMPPAVAFGLFLGGQEWNMAYGAGLLLAANIICISIAAQLVFLLRGIRPRTYYMRKKSEQSIKYNMLFWGGFLLIIIALIIIRIVFFANAPDVDINIPDVL